VWHKIKLIKISPEAGSLIWSEEICGPLKLQEQVTKRGTLTVVSCRRAWLTVRPSATAHMVLYCVDWPVRGAHSETRPPWEVLG
jgi:hypothetical protein